ncbi:hypothetical protein EVAR_75593_1 [Eumeta japonica]|uniref:Uncharacterized protein n=1 Tax=Eumeta variegata TaxID=151549 RepID=A0A4C1TZV2_EUMVA|nr:hypothetical protein EVAR_75593_1 [Eumeta japonica]
MANQWFSGAPTAKQTADVLHDANYAKYDILASLERCRRIGVRLNVKSKRCGPLLALMGVVHPTQLLANRHLVKLGLIKKSERKKTLSIIDRRHTARNPPTIERSVRIVRRGNPGCGLTRR